MQHIATTISKTTIRIRYADDPDPAKATEWVDFQVKIAELRPGSGTAISDPELVQLAELRRAALRRAQDELTGESHRLQALENRISRRKDEGA